MRAILQKRGLRYIFAANMISMLGSGMNAAAVAWYILQATHSKMALGLFAVLQTLPAMLMLPFTGVLIDRENRRRLVMWLDAVRAIVILTVAVLALTNRVKLWEVYLMNTLVAAGFWLGRWRISECAICAADDRPGERPAFDCDLHGRTRHLHELGAAVSCAGHRCGGLRNHGIGARRERDRDQYQPYGTGAADFHGPRAAHVLFRRDWATDCSGISGGSSCAIKSGCWILHHWPGICRSVCCGELAGCDSGRSTGSQSGRMINN